MIKNVLFYIALSCVILTQHIHSSDRRDEQDQAIGNSISLPPVVIDEDSKVVMISQPQYEITVDNMIIPLPNENPEKFSFSIKNQNHGIFYFELSTTSEPFILRNTPGTLIPEGCSPILHEISLLGLQEIDYCKNAYFKIEVEKEPTTTSDYRIYINNISFLTPHDALRECFAVSKLGKYKTLKEGRVSFRLDVAPNLTLYAPRHNSSLGILSPNYRLVMGEEKLIDYDSDFGNNVKFTIKVTKPESR